jgi:RimJ/RimL family protein N-acetyltransferase
MSSDCKIVPVTPAHADTMVRWIDSPESLMQWAGPVFKYPLTSQQLIQHFRSMDANPPESIGLAAIAGESLDLLGYVELSKIDMSNRMARVSRVIVGDPRRRGKGLGRTIVQGALTHAFEILRLHRVELSVFDFNQAAICCYLKLGFRIEGFARECRKVGGDYWSIYNMGILENEWRLKCGQEA